MIKKIKKSIAKVTWPRRRRLLRAKLREQALADMRHLQAADVKEAVIRASKHLLICCLGPDSSGLEVFLKHYRDMGIDHMLLVDDSGSEEVATLLASQSDCSVWKPLLGLRESEYGKRFFHSLLQTYCIGKWTLCVEPEELFIFPYMETRRIQDLTGQLDDCDRTTLWAFEIETYGAGPVLQTERSLDEVRYFDPAGYYQTYGKLGQIEVRGGPGMRFAQSCSIAGNPELGRLPVELLLKECPEAFESLLSASRMDLAPFLNRIPLVKPDIAFFYQNLNRNVLDEKNNWPHKWHPCPTGVLLVPKYHKHYGENLLDGRGMDSRIMGLSSVESLLAKRLKMEPQFSFKEVWSESFESSESLIDCGLMSDGAALRPSARFAVDI